MTIIGSQPAPMRPAASLPGAHANERPRWALGIGRLGASPHPVLALPAVDGKCAPHIFLAPAIRGIAAAATGSWQLRGVARRALGRPIRA